MYCWFFHYWRKRPLYVTTIKRKTTRLSNPWFPLGRAKSFSLAIITSVWSLQGGETTAQTMSTWLMILTIHTINVRKQMCNKVPKRKHLRGSLKSIFEITVPTCNLKVMHFISALKLETTIYQGKSLPDTKDNMIYLLKADTTIIIKNRTDE